MGVGLCSFVSLAVLSLSMFIVSFSVVVLFTFLHDPESDALGSVHHLQIVER
jgi:hypothetical protein